MKNRVWLFMVIAAAAIFWFLAPAIPQDESYHRFADARSLFGVPNFWNVVSNAPFALVGAIGLWSLRGAADRVLFGGVLLTCFGSAYYHLAPTDARLIWDRLPMTVIFMAFLACVVSEAPSGRLLAAMVGAGLASVVWWSFTNDLRPYTIVKYGPVLVLLPALWSSAERKHLWTTVALFGLAQIAELRDGAIYGVIPVSGHTIKHLLAGLATWSIFCWRCARSLLLAEQPSFQGAVPTHRYHDRESNIQ